MSSLGRSVIVCEYGSEVFFHRQRSHIKLGILNTYICGVEESPVEDLICEYCKTQDCDECRILATYCNTDRYHGVMSRGGRMLNTLPCIISHGPILIETSI